MPGNPRLSQRPPSPVLRASDAPTGLRVYRAAPGPELADVVDYLWGVEWDVPDGEVRTSRVLSRPCVHLTVNPEGPRVTGVVTRTFVRELPESGWTVGAAMLPGGFSALTDVALAGLTDRRPAAHQVVRGLAEDAFAAVYTAPPSMNARFAAYAQVLAAVPREPHPDATTVTDAVARIEADPSLTRVDVVAAHFGITARTLQRRFERYLGIGPKWVIQRSRVLETLAQLDADEPVDWAELAVRLGFADQSHLVNVFRDAVGVSPGAYAARECSEGL